MRSFLIALSVFPLKIHIGGSMVPLAVAESTTVTCFFSLPDVRTIHSLEPVLQILFAGIMSKKAGVSSIFAASERGYFPIRM